MREISCLFFYVKAIREWLFGRPVDEEQMDEEMRQHIRSRAMSNINAGMHPQSAYSHAACSFGDIDAHKESCRNALRGGKLNSFLCDTFRIVVRLITKVIYGSARLAEGIIKSKEEHL